jgi:fibronectin type 3 domain-containing protein
MNDTDDKNNFSVIHTINGSDTVYTKSDLTEQVTYYFKIQAFDEVPNNSSFSDIVSATPPDETHPIAPTGLKISNITHDSLTISWAPNPESDIIGYIVYRSTSLKADYKNITDITTTQFSDTNLEENTFYYYKIKAVDDANLISLFSEYVIAQTLIGPKAPEINNSISDFEIVEDTVDELSINLYYIFKDINNDPLTFNCVGQEHINVTIEQTSGAVILKPEENWNGQETLTFYANDGIFETNYNVTIIVTGVNDPPGLARIIAPEDGLTINEDSEIEFRGECTDLDLSYGDELTFSWNSNNDGEIGVGVNLTGIKLSTGKHKITLTVTDKLGLSSETSITVNVNKIEDDGVGGGSDGFNYIFIIVGIVISLVVLILILKKRKKVTDEIPIEQADLEIRPQQEPERQLQEPITQPEISKEQHIESVPKQLELDLHEQIYIPQEQEPRESSSEPEQFPDEQLEE